MTYLKDVDLSKIDIDRQEFNQNSVLTGKKVVVEEDITITLITDKPKKEGLTLEEKLIAKTGKFMKEREEKLKLIRLKAQ